MTANAASGNRQNYEPAVLAIIDLIQAGKLNQALTLADRHVAEFPKSRIGHLLKGDILLAMSSQLHQVGELVDTQSEALDGLKHQLRNRWRHLQDYSETSRKYVPASLVDMGNHKYVIVTDLKAGRLYLYENQHDRPILVRDYYLTVGAAGYGKEITGDKKTPVGVYSIYEYIEPQKLPDRYGKGAFPVNYPNRFDKYRQRTGYGIWLHGSPSDTYARSPWASDGCFVLSNDDLLDIEQYIDVQTRTPVILSDTIDWISVEQLQLQRNRFLGILESWKRDWESLDTAAYLAHYSKDNFNFGKASFTRWADRKKQVNDAKTFIQVDLDIKSLFVYPGEQDMFVVQYRQKYLSNNYAGEVNKEQYWQRDKQGQWKIIYEG
ncbi:MAG: L,D-transpeptidase family protein [Gammaproteobacteria bacterium]|nr:L,D-transpeptidase family protein [Gammaproteobacteria bacterium]